MKTTAPMGPSRLPLTRLRFKPQTRMEKRRAKRETMEIMRMLMKVDLEFANAVMYSEDNYEDLYHDYLDRWNEVLYKIDHRDYVIVTPNRTYFADSYSKKNQ